MAQEYLEELKIDTLPRLPLEGKIDLTCRCNFNCLHCWIRIPPAAKEKKQELSFDEIKRIADEARSMGCRKWSITGGEPMLRPDFYEIFDYLTRNSMTYQLNTNGSLITPKIARLMKRKGSKMIALYGATAQVHDHITRNPGQFEKVMRGFHYLKEAKAGFIVQPIPMKDNYHQWKAMMKLAASLSKDYRCGATWLYLSASGDSKKNREIIAQRLPSKEVIGLDKPDLSYDEFMAEEKNSSCAGIYGKNEFHIDAYGSLSFCGSMKHPEFRYDLRKGNFRDGWDNFIPSLDKKLEENGWSSKPKKGRPFCPCHYYLEHRSFRKEADYLDAVKEESIKYEENWKKNHRRYFKIADITVQVESDLPINEQTFHPKFKHFEVQGRGEDTITLRHQFSLPDLGGKEIGREFYRKAPWAIYKNNGSWVYLAIATKPEDKSLQRVATFNTDHTRAIIYNDKEEAFLKGNLISLTMFPTDQILLARILADRQGFFIHACGVVLNAKGFIFVGHSEAGKSTVTRMLKGKAEILCDDRMIVRRKMLKGAYQESGFNIHGTWSHGDVPDVSSACAPLKGIFFLEKADENTLIGLKDKKEIAKRLLSCLIRPFVTVDWWQKVLPVLEDVSDQVPCYVMKFDKSGKIVDLLEKV